MSGRFNPYLLILLGILMAAFLLNAPVAFATKLPTACNLFDKKQIEKSGPCGYKALLSKCQSFEEAVVLVSGAELENGNCIIPPNSIHSILSSNVIISHSEPLRC
jgi:hypothetical protein